MPLQPQFMQYLSNDSTKGMTKNELWHLAYPQDPYLAELYRAEKANEQPRIGFFMKRSKFTESFKSRVMEEILVDGKPLGEGTIFSSSSSRVFRELNTLPPTIETTLTNSS